LNIYIPKDSKDQEICYLRLLPTKLFNETMMAEVDSNSTLAFDSRAVSIITAIFASSDEVVDLVLEEAGIVPVPYPDQYEEELQQSPSDDIVPSPGIDQQRNPESETTSVGSGTQSGTSTPGALSLRLLRTEQTISQVFYHSRFSSSAVTQDLAPSLFFQIIYDTHLHLEVAKRNIDDYSTTSSLQQGIKEGGFHPRELSILTNS
jgi:hypothetical protein